MQIKNDEKKRRLAALFSLYLLPKAVLCAKGCMACFMLESPLTEAKQIWRGTSFLIHDFDYS